LGRERGDRGSRVGERKFSGRLNKDGKKKREGGGPTGVASDKKNHRGNLVGGTG